MTPELQTFLEGIGALVVMEEKEGVLFQDPRGGPLMMAAHDPASGYRVAVGIAAHLTVAARDPAELAETYEEMWAATNSVMGLPPDRVPEQRGRDEVLEALPRRTEEQLHDLLMSLDQMIEDRDYRTGVFARRPDKSWDWERMRLAGEDLRTLAIAELLRRRAT